MAEVFTGKLSFDTGKWKLVFFDEKKKRDGILFCQKGIFSAGFEPKEGEETEVQFERDATPERKAIKVRPKDAEWQEPARVRAVPARNADRHPPRDQRNNRGRANERQRGYADQPESEAMANQRQTLPGEFHNPYNFVPAPSRDVVDPELGDHVPAGHDRYHAEKYTGKLRVRMQIETPLLLLDTTRMHYDENKEHKSYPVRLRPLLDKSGNVVTNSSGKVIEVPDINPTAIKGMLRSAYEAVTNSRLSVFKEHDERLAFRAEVKDGLIAVPARIEGGKIVFYTGNSQIEKTDGGPRITGTKPNGQPIRESQYAAWVKMYETNGFIKVNGKNVFKMSDDEVIPQDDLNKPPFHQRKAWAWIEAFDHGRFTSWEVIELAYAGSNLGPMPKPSANAISAAPQKVEGYICSTGKTMKNKHDERFFFGRNTTHDVDLEQHHLDSWNRLIKNYRQEHEGNLGSPPKASQYGTDYSLEWSRHIQRTAMNETSRHAGLIAEELKDGALCYARVEWNDAKTDFDVLELYPVMIPRRLHKSSPAKLLPDALNLKPAEGIEKLSPADRVFGWVRQGKGDGVVAYRGQVRIGTVECSKDADGNDVGDDAQISELIERFGEDNVPKDSLPLQILGQPKPQQGRFYVAEDETGKAQSPGRNNERAGYKSGRGLRGRKVYPHHANLPRDYWIEDVDVNNERTEAQRDLSQDQLISDGHTFFREYIRPKTAKRRDSQNRSIQGWVKEGVEFTFDIHFINLSKVELGALIWLLSLNDGLEDAKYFHRFGGGKPLGFGSVSLNLVVESSQITSGGDLKEFYQSLDSTRKESISAAETKTAFETAYLSAGYQTIIAAFLRASEGFADKLPIHYPRAGHVNNANPVPPHTDGLAYEWFVENAKAANPDNAETRLVLQALVNDKGESDTGLPILYHKL